MLLYEIISGKWRTTGFWFKNLSQTELKKKSNKNNQVNKKQIGLGFWLLASTTHTAYSERKLRYSTQHTQHTYFAFFFFNSVRVFSWKSVEIIKNISQNKMMYDYLILSLLKKKCY